MYTRILPGAEVQIIGIHDAKSLAEGYNRGIEQSRGELLIFSHDDIEIFHDNLAPLLIDRLSTYDMIGVAGTRRLVGPMWMASGHNFIAGQIAEPDRKEGGYMIYQCGTWRRVIGGIQAMDGLFLATRRHLVQQLRFDAERFDGFHLYDVDFTYAAYRAGFRLAVCCDIPILHESSGQFGQIWQKYARRFVEKHQLPNPVWNLPNERVACVIVPAKEQIPGAMRIEYWE
jgi:GT2 family glycosyltransferase